MIGNERRMPSNFSQIEEMEQNAKQKELGIWSKSLKLVSDSKQQSYQNKYDFLESITVEMVNVVDGRYFYVRVLDNNAHYAKVESLMANFDPSSA